MRIQKLILCSILFSLSLIYSIPSHASATGTAWGVLTNSQCFGSPKFACSLTLIAAGSTDQTTVKCEGGYYGPCAAIPVGDTVIVSVYIKPIQSCFVVSPIQYLYGELHATDLPQHYH